MNWIEIIQLRAFSQKERDEAVSAFRQLLLPHRETGLQNIQLFRNFTLSTDLSILIGWRGRPPQRGKTPLGSQMAAAFSQFGRIYHAIWTPEDDLDVKQGRLNR